MGTADSFPQPSPENCESVHGIHRSSTADPPPAHTARKAQATYGRQDIHNLVQHYYCCLYSKKRTRGQLSTRRFFTAPSTKPGTEKRTEGNGEHDEDRARPPGVSEGLADDRALQQHQKHHQRRKRHSDHGLRGTDVPGGHGLQDRDTLLGPRHPHRHRGVGGPAGPNLRRISQKNAPRQGLSGDRRREGHPLRREEPDPLRHLAGLGIPQHPPKRRGGPPVHHRRGRPCPGHLRGLRRQLDARGLSEVPGRLSAEGPEGPSEDRGHGRKAALPLPVSLRSRGGGRPAASHSGP